MDFFDYILTGLPDSSRLLWEGEVDNFRAGLTHFENSGLNGEAGRVGFCNPGDFDGSRDRRLRAGDVNFGELGTLVSFHHGFSQGNVDLRERDVVGNGEGMQRCLPDITSFDNLK